MTFPKVLALIALFLFGTIGALALFKAPKQRTPERYNAPIEIELEEAVVALPTPPAKQVVKEPVAERVVRNTPPEANRIEELFRTSEPRLPFVETITYKSRVDWQKGRPAWISDYASHYQTSRHFIARSLNGKVDYLKQDVKDGDRFNVFKQDRPLSFYLVIDATDCKLWLYAYDETEDQRTLLKTYSVGLGRPDSSRTSGLLTPLGSYQLGSKVAIYKPGVTGIYNGEKTEMIRVFGSRWIPFEKEIADTTAPAKGLGIHGVPWAPNSKGELTEDLSSIGLYESDGCVRMATDDIEEIFAITITKPTTLVLVKNFFEASLPGKE